MTAVSEAAPGRPLRVLLVHRISEEKGLPQLIRAMRLLPDTPLHVVGDGPQRAFAESQAQSDGAGATFHGWCTTEETYALMDSSAVLCVPSLWYENCPTVVLEAFARRLPDVGSNQGGTLELLEGGKSGAVVDPRDSLGLAAALAVATEDGEWRAQVVERAYRRFSTVYSPQAYSSGILDLYAELVDRKVS